MTIDRTGQRFGRLTVIKEAGRDKHRNVIWKCRCDCGNESYVTTADLKKTKSCGCWNIDAIIQRNTRHGASKRGSITKLYKVWAAVKQRCTNPKNKAYKNYGGRGIKLCDEWLEYESFEKWAFENGYAEGLQLDRIDNNGSYSPDNCRFVSTLENSHNKRNNVWITIDGKTALAVDWAKEVGVDVEVIRKRLRKGWTPKEAVFAPLGTRR